MPELCAERRDPPTAMILQPGRVRLSKHVTDEHGSEEQNELNGRPNTEPGADEVPDLRIGKAAGNLHRVFEQQHVDDGADNDQRHQRRQKCAQPEQADQHAVEQADQAAGSERAEECGADRPTENVHHGQRGEIAEREIRADREIDAAGDHDDHHGEHDEAELAELSQRNNQAGGTEEIGDQIAEQRDRNDEKGEWRDIIDPALGENLAEHMVGDVFVARANKGFAQARLARRALFCAAAIAMVSTIISSRPL